MAEGTIYSGRFARSCSRKRGRIKRPARLQDDVTDQAFFSRVVLAHGHHAIFNAGAGLQARLDFAEFDAVTLHFHLEIIAPQEFDITIR